MDSFEREDNGEEASLVFDLPKNNVDFDDFHPYPLTFEDAILTHDVPRLSENFTSVIPMDLDFGHEEVDPSDRDIDPEWVEMDWGNGPAEEPLPNGNASHGPNGHEPGGSELSSAVNGVTGNGSSVDDSTGNHEFADGVLEDISSDDPDPNEVSSNDSISSIHDPWTQRSASSHQMLSTSTRLRDRHGSWTSRPISEVLWGSQRRG